MESTHSQSKSHKSSSSSSGGGHISLEEVTVMKLMEEIMEFDQEIKMKQRWINARMKILHNLTDHQEKKEMKQVIYNFLLKL